MTLAAKSGSTVTLVIIIMIAGVLFSLKRVSLHWPTAGYAAAAANFASPPSAVAGTRTPPLTTLPPSPLNDFRAALLSCFGDQPEFFNIAAAKDFPTLLMALEQDGVDHQQKVVENFRFRLPDGDEQRLELRYGTNEASVEMHLFGLRVDGTTELIHIPPEDVFNPPVAVVERYLAAGDVILHQTHHRVLYHLGLVADINEVNDRISEIAMQTPQGSFYCRGSNCRCR